MSVRRLCLGFLFCMYLVSGVAAAQVMDGELRVTVHDMAGQAIPAHVQLVGRAPDFVAEADANSSGEAVLRRVPAGIYQLRVQHRGFSDYNRAVEIRSAIPRSLRVALQIATVTAEVTVEDSVPLLDPAQPI